MHPLSANFNVASALATDFSGATLRQILDLLEEQRTALRRSADQGLAPEVFAVSSELQQACATASRLAEGVWARRHKAQSTSPLKVL